MIIDLSPEQLEAVSEVKNGNIICGGVGTGKSRTGLAYYWTRYGQSLDGYDYSKIMPDLYIITTAMKRNSLEWEEEMAPFQMHPNPDRHQFSNKVVIDSWNNIQKYKDIRGAFFIFDEQRAVGSGPWSKAFIRIAKNNGWIMLSATPGDQWKDFIPIFIANGFYRTRTEFENRHFRYSRYAKFPCIIGYFEEPHLYWLRDSIMVDIRRTSTAEKHHIDVWASFDKATYLKVARTRFDIWNNEPFANAGTLCLGLRKIVNSDISRSEKVLELFRKHKKVIIFYNFDYELDILKGLNYDGAPVAEYNGHKHQPIPDSDSWVYLVQYTAGCEGWNCILTDTIIFYSLNYSWRVTTQACGRIDRRNTPFKDLYYYHIKSRSGIDRAIENALNNKEDFNARKFVG